MFFFYVHPLKKWGRIDVPHIVSDGVGWVKNPPTVTVNGFSLGGEVSGPKTPNFHTRPDLPQEKGWRLMTFDLKHDLWPLIFIQMRCFFDLYPKRPRKNGQIWTRWTPTCTLQMGLKTRMSRVYNNPRYNMVFYHVFSAIFFWTRGERYME